MIHLRSPSPFINLLAVEAWDAWFRWREQAGLRDFSIEDTWRRVAVALASIEAGGEISTWQARFMDALASWRLLPDERLLADAGTGRVTWRDGVLHASLNAAAFVSPGSSAAGSMDLGAFSDCAALAVRALDNAALMAGVVASRLRVGIVGMADALALLNLRYGSAAGRAQAAAMVRSLSEGCLRGSIMLAAVRGACCGDPDAIMARARQRHAPSHLLRAAARHGVRHEQLTAITRQPRLALLANDVSDATDPLRDDRCPRLIAVPERRCEMHSSGYALDVLRNREGAAFELPETLAVLPRIAQIEMRAALQPWVDEPISYSLPSLPPGCPWRQEPGGTTRI